MDKRDDLPEGWIPWEGGECPVGRSVRVDVRFRDGCIEPNRKGRVCFLWNHTGDKDDIIAYRLVETADATRGNGGT